MSRIRRYRDRSSAFARTRSAWRPCKRSEAHAVLAGLDAQVGDLVEIHEDGAVGRLDLVIALLAVLQGLLEGIELVVVEPQREHLGAVGESEGCAARADGGLGRVGHGCQCSAGWTI